jgi:hypothetical protein
MKETNEAVSQQAWVRTKRISNLLRMLHSAFKRGRTQVRHIFSAAAVNIGRSMRWLDEQPLAQTRTSALASIHAATPA